MWKSPALPLRILESFTEEVTFEFLIQDKFSSQLEGKYLFFTK